MSQLVHDTRSCPSVVDDQYWFPTYCGDFHIVAILIKPTVNSEFKIQSLFSIYRSSGGTGSSERKHDVLAGEVSGSLDVNLEVSIVSVGEVGEEILLE